MSNINNKAFDEEPKLLIQSKSYQTLLIRNNNIF